ncbi:MAG: sulfate reduction electron transfer complex DsrMKJOP subunit DsrO [Bryobacteraceae bacterium]
MKITRKTFLLLAVAGSKAAGQGRRWAMAIDLEKCRKKPGCTLCMDACHKAHNVPAIPDRARELKWIWKAPFARVFPEVENAALAEVETPVLCNHCDNPPCVRVCPTGATWKRADGIVAMDWHRCIGCRYCVAACPYGSRSFNWMDPRPHIKQVNADFPTRTRGVVEKCTFCEERLARGQKPVCVEACPEGAMVFGELSQIAKMGRFSIRRKPQLGTKPEVFYIVS